MEDEVASVRSRAARVMTTLMRNARDRRSENPFWAIARLERVVVFGTDQRITSGPAATVAASRWRQTFTRKQAAYMAAPERFAKRQIPLAPRAPSIHGPKRRFAAPRRYVSNWARVDGMPHLELIFPHLESADGCNARLLGPMRETWRDVEDHGHFTQVES